MTIEEVKQKAYTNLKDGLDAVFVRGAIPNIKAIKKELVSVNKRINTIETGSAFARSLEEVNKAELAIARLSGEREAWQERIDWINERLRG